MQSASPEATIMFKNVLMYRDKEVMPSLPISILISSSYCRNCIYIYNFIHFLSYLPKEIKQFIKTLFIPTCPFLINVIEVPIFAIIPTIVIIS